MTPDGRTAWKRWRDLSNQLNQLFLSKYRNQAGRKSTTFSRRPEENQPNGIPYKVYKYCKRLRKRLWKLLRVARRKREGQRREAAMKTQGGWMRWDT